ncbi:MAG: hypothetical protein Q8S13_06295, partial [Dehalococcoidia bacterium]|nr:hypothetical protein [Dehalococcoidia bacterium]
MIAGRWARRLPMYALLTLCAAILLFPLYVTVVYSLHPIAEFLNDPPPSLWPSDPQWGNYFSGGGAAADTPLPRYLTNSFVMAGVITLGQLITAGESLGTSYRSPYTYGTRLAKGQHDGT